MKGASGTRKLPPLPKVLPKYGASGAARIVVRTLLAKFGLPNAAVPKSTSGAQIGPQGVVGSLAHDSRVATAAVGKRRDFVAMGIGVEPAEELPFDLIDLVTIPGERAITGSVPCGGAVCGERGGLTRLTKHFPNTITSK
jgi:4'-phosphopantetheinyl transferase EntD